VGLFIQAIKFIWPTIKEVLANAWGHITGFFSGAGGFIVRLKDDFVNGIKGWIMIIDYAMAYIINGITSIGGKIVHGLISPFEEAWSWVKSLWGGNSPSQVGLSILNGIVSIGASIYDALTSPFRRGLAWIMDKIPGMGKFADKVRGGATGAIGSVEKRAQAAYIPAVTVTPNGTKIETPKGKAEAASAKSGKDDSRGMSEETGQKMVALLEKILAKDNSLYVDGSLLSTKLAQTISFKGSFGTNR
jgi:hypothetical protein